VCTTMVIALLTIFIKGGFTIRMLEILGIPSGVDPSPYVEKVVKGGSGGGGVAILNVMFSHCLSVLCCLSMHYNLYIYNIIIYWYRYIYIYIVEEASQALQVPSLGDEVCVSTRDQRLCRGGGEGSGSLFS
jgi:hypothetical protein